MASSMRQRKRKGLVIVFTGDGKGKTTAAIGMAVRAAGHGMRVKIVQFIKGTWRTGETEALKALAPHVEHVRTGRGFTIERMRDPRVSDEEHREAARRGLALAAEAIRSGSYDLVVLDELLGAIKADLVSITDVLALMTGKPPMLHVVITGRDAPPELVDAADMVTEMRLVKHPYQQGIRAQPGVEF